MLTLNVKSRPNILQFNVKYRDNSAGSVKGKLKQELEGTKKNWLKKAE